MDVVITLAIFFPNGTFKVIVVEKLKNGLQVYEIISLKLDRKYLLFEVLIKCVKCS